MAVVIMMTMRHRHRHSNGGGDAAEMRLLLRPYYLGPGQMDHRGHSVDDKHDL